MSLEVTREEGIVVVRISMPKSSKGYLSEIVEHGVARAIRDWASEDVNQTQGILDEAAGDLDTSLLIAEAVGAST